MRLLTRKSGDNSIAVTVAMVLTVLSSDAMAQEHRALPDIPGWTILPDSTTHTPDNLYDIIDGAADVYLSYGFQDLRTCSYRNTAGSEVRLEIYRHATPADAFGVYSQERKPEYHFLEIGTEGYDDAGVVNFLHGRYYIKLSSIDTGSAAHGSILEIARRVAAACGPPSGLPNELSLFPQKNRVRRAEMYIARDYLGVSALGNAFVAPLAGKPSRQMFLIPHGDRASAEKRWRDYRSAIGVKTPATAGVAGTLADPHNGRIGIMVKGNYVAGVVGVQDERECLTLLLQLAQNLP